MSPEIGPIGPRNPATLGILGRFSVGELAGFESDFAQSIPGMDFVSSPQASVEALPGGIDDAPSLEDVLSAFDAEGGFVLTDADLDFLSENGVQSESLTNELSETEVKRLDAIDRSGRIAAQAYFADQVSSMASRDILKAITGIEKDEDDDDEDDDGGPKHSGVRVLTRV